MINELRYKIICYGFEKRWKIGEIESDVKIGETRAKRLVYDISLGELINSIGRWLKEKSDDENDDFLRGLVSDKGGN